MLIPKTDSDCQQKGGKYYSGQILWCAAQTHSRNKGVSSSVTGSAAGWQSPRVCLLQRRPHWGERPHPRHHAPHRQPRLSDKTGQRPSPLVPTRASLKGHGSSRTPYSICWALHLDCITIQLLPLLFLLPSLPSPPFPFPSPEVDLKSTTG